MIRNLRFVVTIPTTAKEHQDESFRDDLYRKLELYYGSEIKVVKLRPE